MSESPGDICKCGNDRSEHDAIGPREFHDRTLCTSFRLSCTAAEMSEAIDEWHDECRRRGV